MKDGHNGVLKDWDRRSRESVLPRRARMSDEWVLLNGRLDHQADVARFETSRRAWLHPLPLWWTAFTAGRMPLLRAAEICRRKLFQEPVRLSRFIAMYYVAPLTKLPEELPWLRELGVSQAVLTIGQQESEAQQMRSLTAIKELHAVNCRVAAVLLPNQDAVAQPEQWQQFCQWILSQAGWQLDFVQLGGALDEVIRHRRELADFAPLFSHVPQLRHDYPGVALLAPWMERFDAPLALKTLRQLLPVGAVWDGVTLRTPAWQVLDSMVREHLFLRQLTLTGAAALLPEFAGRRVQVVFPPLPPGCDAAGAERVVGSMVRRIVLALCSGMADQAAVSIDPAMPMSERQTLSTAIRELAVQLEGARFVQRVRTGDAQRDFVLEFERLGKPPLLIGWTDSEPRQVAVPFAVSAATDYLHRSAPLLPRARVRLTRNMTYFVRDD